MFSNSLMKIETKDVMQQYMEREKWIWKDVIEESFLQQKKTKLVIASTRLVN